MEAIGGFAVFIMVLAVFAVIFIAKSVRVVPQQATRNLFHDRSFFHLCFLKAHGRASRYADS